MKLALRRLLRNPGFTATAVVTLALSIQSESERFTPARQGQTPLT
jgi:hypothetical protein